MKAFALKRYSKSNGVYEIDVDVPQPREGDVLVQVCAASVNPLDLKIRNGELKSLLPVQASADIG
jgi:NADPH:quinone reductase-like Zn-dependent oxidoreductase